MVVFLPRHVYAYLDPGTGSLIFQAAMAALAATAYAVRVYWRKLRGLFSRRTALPASSAMNRRTAGVSCGVATRSAGPGRGGWVERAVIDSHRTALL